MGGGVLLLILLVGGAMMFGGGGGSSGGGTDCGRVTLTADMVVPRMQELAAIMAASGPNDEAFPFVQKAMQLIYPSCPWARDTQATIVGPKGEVSWQAAVAAMGSHTIAEVNADPEFQGLMQIGPEGISPSSTSLQAAGRFLGIGSP